MSRASSGRPALPTAGSTSASSWPGGEIPRKPSPLMRNQRERKTARRRLRCPVPTRRITVMIEKISNLAERLATNVSQSRRGFLAGVGKAALGVAGALGGLLALPGTAQAGPHNGKCVIVYNGGRSY